MPGSVYEAELYSGPWIIPEIPGSAYYTKLESMDGQSCLTPLDTTPNDQHTEARASAGQAAQRAKAAIKGKERGLE